ncbi:hypothetical protein D9M72_593450 [compost metagenome]
MPEFLLKNSRAPPILRLVRVGHHVQRDVGLVLAVVDPQRDLVVTDLEDRGGQGVLVVGIVRRGAQDG